MSENTYFLNQQHYSLDYNNAVSLLDGSGLYTPPTTGWVASKSGVLFLYSYFADGHGSLSGWINGTRVFYIGSGSSSCQISVPVTKGDIVQFKNEGANASDFGNCSFWGFTFVPYK